MAVTVRAVARVNVAAIEANAAALCRVVGPDVALCAVVKADGYGHGSVAAARAAQAGGATWLAVATAIEAAALRAHTISGRLLVMGALTADELTIALDADADIVVWRQEMVAAIDRPARVHVKYDTGMGRLGTRERDEASRVADAVARAPQLELVGAMTHFATADERGDDFFAQQLARFEQWVAPLRERYPAIVVHAANSAAALRDPGARFDLVRAGIAVYGMDPFHERPDAHGLAPALELCSYVAEIKACGAGESAGYGRRFVARKPTLLATVPIGYGDGVRRGLTDNADVVIGGRRFPLVGTVSMDNVTVDLGPDGGGVSRGDEVVLIGAGVSAEEWARRLGTINYEVTCAISARVPRVHHRDGVAVPSP